MLKYNVDKNFANIDVILKQRVDEIPNLIAVVKKTQGYEESLLNQLTELRTAFLSSRSTDEKVQLANEVGKLLNSFFAVSENYPELKAVESFRTLQLRVSDLEDMLSDRINSLICYTSVLGIIASLILLCHIEYRDGELQINLPFGNKGISSGQYGYILPSNQEKTIIFKHQ